MALRARLLPGLAGARPHRPDRALRGADHRTPGAPALDLPAEGLADARRGRGLLLPGGTRRDPPSRGGFHGADLHLAGRAAHPALARAGRSEDGPARPGGRCSRSWCCSRSGRTFTAGSSRASCFSDSPPSGSRSTIGAGYRAPSRSRGSPYSAPRRPRRGDGHRRHPARGGDLGLPAQLPEPGDLTGEHRVGVGVQLSAGGRLPVPGDLLRRVDVGSLTAAAPCHHSPGDGGIPRLRWLLGSEHRLHRPGPRPAGGLDRAESGPDADPRARRPLRRGRGRGDPRLGGVLGPARDDPTLSFPVADYAIAHPPAHGRIVTYAGVGSYINWRSPNTPVVINGWLEQYTPQELQDNYRVLRAGTSSWDIASAVYTGGERPFA